MKKGKDFEPDVIRREFELPDNLEPVNILAVGYSDEEALIRRATHKLAFWWMNWFPTKRYRQAYVVTN